MQTFSIVCENNRTFYREREREIERTREQSVTSKWDDVPDNQIIEASNREGEKGRLSVTIQKTRWLFVR